MLWSAEGGRSSSVHDVRGRVRNNCGCYSPTAESTSRHSIPPTFVRIPTSLMSSVTKNQCSFCPPFCLCDLHEYLSPFPLLCVHQRGEEYCNICYCESLSQAPCVRLHCGHDFHYHCLVEKIQTGFPGVWVFLFGEVSWLISVPTLCERFLRCGLLLPVCAANVVRPFHHVWISELPTVQDPHPSSCSAATHGAPSTTS